MITITELEQTCGACPTQYSGTTNDGRRIYIRFRWGNLYMSVGGETIFSQPISDGLDGIISLEEIKKATQHLSIVWP